MSRRYQKRGFTLIELLVVIAIIAILAAILFPVFAQAREKARQISCLSNEKQISLAVLQYNQDYDEIMPLFFVDPPAESCGALPGGSCRMTWIGLCQPYLKSYDVMKCPDMPLAAGIWPPARSAFNSTPLRNISLWEGYGWNVDYMDFAQDCNSWTGSSGPPTPLAAIGQPAATVMLAGSSLEPGDGSFAGANDLYPIHGGYYPLLAPATLTTPEGCTYSNAGWGQGSYMGPYGGFEQPRHAMMGGNVSFCDGHVKFMTAGALAAGTDWNPNKLNSDIHVIDRNQYLWDLQ